jgi:hypothetical protein
MQRATTRVCLWVSASWVGCQYWSDVGGYVSSISSYQSLRSKFSAFRSNTGRPVADNLSRFSMAQVQVDALGVSQSESNWWEEAC